MNDGVRRSEVEAAPLGKRLHLASNSSNSPDRWRSFISSPSIPHGEDSPWGKDSISLRIPPTVLVVGDLLYLCRQVPQGGGSPLGKRLHLASDSSNSPDRWRSFISSPSISPRRRPPLGKRLHLASDSSNSPDLLEIFFIFAVNSPKAETAPWGKDSILLRIPPTVLTC